MGFVWILSANEKKLIFLSPSRTADENDVRVGQEMALPCPCVSDTRTTCVLSFYLVERQAKEQERKKRLDRISGIEKALFYTTDRKRKRKTSEHLEGI